jgi:hypothetical protein
LAKSWEQLTQAEKIEDLRSDMKKVMGTINAWMESHRILAEGHGILRAEHSGTSNQATEVAAAVQDLENRVAKLER